MSQPVDFAPRIAEELALAVANVRATIALLDGGATVPFIARYRKEQTGELDEVQIRAIEDKNAYCTDLHKRRESILAEIDSQGKLTPELRARILACWVKSTLEDIYLPFKPKRRTRAKIARERGLEPLALRILAQPNQGQPEHEAAAFVSAEREVPDVATALAGARDIVAEMIADRTDVRTMVRETYTHDGVFAAEAIKSKTKVPTKFEMYYDFKEPLRTLPSHRYLAICRGEEEGILRAGIDADKTQLAGKAAALAKVAVASAWAGELRRAADDAIERLVCPSIESDVRTSLKLAADLEAVRIFATNMQKVLLQPALGRKTVIGIDPGQRTGCKCVVVDDTGKLLHHTLINLVQGPAALAHAKATLCELVARYAPFAFAIGNGTHGRETADFCRALGAPKDGASALVVMVNESGASVYSASDVAREEFPELDLTVRGAISIARRLQDPLAELVKLDPKVIGVGQYQHDVNQPLLKRKLEEVVESCVNAVGVELNTASAELLSYVAGVGAALAKKIVKYRDTHGAFKTRKELLKVESLGAKAFEQCAGFIRLRGSENPLDASAVHPERYALVSTIAKDAKLRVEDLLGNEAAVAKIAWGSYASASVGLPTLEDIKRELVKPGRDPRSAFEATAFRDDIRTMDDLKPGMKLEGIITNVTAFGAFVDIGVHQDGLVHISQLSDKFVRDPHEVAKVGEKIQVHVVEVDLVRKRIALSAKSGAPSTATTNRGPAPSQDRKPQSGPLNPATKPAQGTFQNNPFAKLRPS